MNTQGGYDIQDLQVGMTASVAKTVTETDIVLFAGVSTDVNPVHLNEEFARTTMFKGVLRTACFRRALSRRCWPTSCLGRARFILGKP